MMNRRTMLMLGGSAVLLAGCASAMGAGPQLGADGQPLPQVYNIAAQGAGTIEFRLLDSVNTLRSSRGAGPLALNAALNAAAATHSRDMSVQNRPWHFGSDGSSPLLRAQRAGDLVALAVAVVLVDQVHLQVADGRAGAQVVLAHQAIEVHRT